MRMAGRRWRFRAGSRCGVRAGARPATTNVHFPYTADMFERVETFASGTGEIRLVKADNVAAMRHFVETGERPFDVVFADPPYAGGRPRGYEDARRGWIDQYEPAFKLMRTLMAPTGVLIACGADETLPMLRQMLDGVFRVGNYLGTVVHLGQSGNRSRFLAATQEYLVIYARNRRALVKAGARWRERKPGVDEMLAKAREIRARSRSLEEAEEAWALHVRENYEWGDGLSRYSYLDDDGRPFRLGPLVSPGSAIHDYDIVHPVTGRPVKKPARGWRHPEAEMKRLIEAGEVRFGADENSVPSRILYLDEHADMPPQAVFQTTKGLGSLRLAELLGVKRTPFPYPKDPEVVARWIRIVTEGRPDARVLDPFGGSGTTAEAVMTLNAADGGGRHCVLIQNGESLDDQADAAGVAASGIRGPIFDVITVPRVREVVRRAPRR